MFIFCPKIKCSIVKKYYENLEVYTEVLDMCNIKKSVDVQNPWNIQSELGIRYQVPAIDVHVWRLEFQLPFLSWLRHVGKQPLQLYRPWETDAQAREMIQMSRTFPPAAWLNSHWLLQDVDNHLYICLVLTLKGHIF